MTIKKLNEKGLSLIEILVVLGIIGITTFATLALQKSNLDAQKQNQLINTAQQLQTRFRHLLTDNQSFGQTLSHNTSGAASMSCLISNPPTSCTGKGGVMSIYDGSGNLFYQSLPNGTSGGNGFTEAGSPCASFSPSGNSNCPFGFVVTWAPQCNGACINPPVALVVQMYYRPSPGNEIPLNPDKYSIGIGGNPFIRSATAMTLSFRLVHASTTGGGTCPTGGSFASRPLAIPTGGDPFGLVMSTGTTVKLKNIGTYKCSGSAVGFAVDGFTSRLLVNGSQVGESTGFAPKWIQGNATYETVFTVGTTGSTLQFQQACANAPGAGVDGFALGMPVPPYSNASTYATLVCALIN